MLKRDVFQKFISLNSKFTDMNDKNLRAKVEQSFGLQQASQRNKSKFYSCFQLKELEPDQILIEIGKTPTDIYFLLSG